MKKSVHEYYIPLENVHSEHCALIVDKGLDTVEGITEHNVELNNERARIVSEKPAEVLPKAVQQIRSLGYDVPTVKVTLPVEGMSCASCAATVQDALGTQPGVLEASVNYANASLLLEFIPSVTDPEQLKQVLQAYGYDLLTDNSPEAQETLEELHRQKYNLLKRRTIGALVLAFPLVVIGMTPSLMNLPYANYIMWALATPVVFYFGKGFFVNAFKQARNKTANMDTLVALSTGVAYLFSVFNTLFPHIWHRKGLHAHVYFEAAAVVIAFILLGRLLEERAKGNTSSAIRKLMGLQPKTVTVVREDHSQAEIPVAEVRVGDVLLVKPGERIAVDGVVVAGSSYVDESMISGEPVPVAKSTDAPVYAGTINQKGSFRFRAEKVGSETFLAQIIRTVQEAQGSKAPVQKQVDKIAAVFVPVVIAIAVISFAVWMVSGAENNVTHAFLALVTVLVIACPCALGLATPTAIMVGVGKAAENGILIKDAESLEIAKKVTAVVLDKTGTITEGKPAVTRLHWFVPETVMLRNLLFTIEKSSEHPLADAIAAYLGKESVFTDHVAVENITGRGIKAEYQEEAYLVGNSELLKDYGVSFSPVVEKWMDEQLALAQTAVLFAEGEKIVAGIAIADKVKATSAGAVRQLVAEGIDVYMLTGDNAHTAKAVASATGIPHYRAGFLPADKAEFIRQLQDQGEIVAMAGDGINDSNALAQADISIAMGKGSDIAMEVARMTIISSDLTKIPQAMKISRSTVAAIKQNLFWAFIYNIIGIPLAAGVLYPVNGFLLDPMIAGGAMAMSSVSVVMNSLRLKWAS